MQNKVNSLILSDSDDLRKIGWFLFDLNCYQNGLSPDEVEMLLDLLHFKDANDQYEKGMHDGYLDGYKEGYANGWSDKENHYDCNDEPE